MAGVGAFVVLRGLLIPEAQCYFRAVILAVTAAINFYVYDPVEAGKIGVYIVGLFGGNIPDLIAVDIDTESRLALPFFPLQSQFHCALVERFVFEVDFSQDGLTAFAPVFEGNARNLHGKKFKTGFVSFVVAEANNGAAGADRTVGATPYGAHFLHGERPRFCDGKRDILRFSHSRTMRVCVVLCAAIFKIDLCFLWCVQRRAIFFLLAAPEH